MGGEAISRSEEPPVACIICTHTAFQSSTTTATTHSLDALSHVWPPSMTQKQKNNPDNSSLKDIHYRKKVYTRETSSTNSTAP